MSRRRRRREPMWVRVAAIAVTAVVALVLIVLLFRGLFGLLGRTRSRGAVESDPQFAAPAETVTRPPELNESGGPVAVGDDPSALWDLGEMTPVDKTAEELGLEAESAG